MSRFFLIVLATLVWQSSLCAGDKFWIQRNDWLRRINPYARQVAYLEGTGTQYINLGHDIGLVGDYVQVSITFEYANPSNFRTYRGFFGIRDGTNGYAWYLGNNSQVYYLVDGICGEADSGSSNITQTNIVYTLTQFCGYRAAGLRYVSRRIIDPTGYVKSWSRNTTNVTTISTAYSYMLFCCDGPDSSFNPTRCQGIRIYGLKIYNYGILKHDYIPVVCYDGRAAFYDNIERKFYYNVGTGEFVLPPGTDTTPVSQPVVSRHPGEDNRVMLSSKTDPYVTTGLIGLWDGMTRPPAGGEWKNLAGPVNLTVAPEVGVLSNGVEFTTLTEGAYTLECGELYNAVSEAHATIEVVVEPTDYVSQGGVFSVCRSASMLRVRSAGAASYHSWIYEIWGLGTLSPVLRNNDTFSKGTLTVVVDTGFTSLYHNGVLITSVVNGSQRAGDHRFALGRLFYGNTAKFKCFGMRWYNRALSPDELKKNHRYDVEHFPIN